MGRILQDVYSDASVAPLLGLKGGTCAYLFYGLARFSVDLDFDFLGDGAAHEPIFEKLTDILARHGAIKDSRLKRFTMFFLLSYGDEDHNIKFEVNIRQAIPNIKELFDIKEYVGISMLVAKKPYLFAGKLAALTLRSEIAMRDIFDIWYFAKHNWDIDQDVVKIMTAKTLKEHLGDCIALIERVNDNQILRGLGESLDEKDKTWVKAHLRKETVLLLKNYLAVLP